MSTELGGKPEIVSLKFQSLVRVVLNEHPSLLIIIAYIRRFQSLVRVVLNEHRSSKLQVCLILQFQSLVRVVLNEHLKIFNIFREKIKVSIPRSGCAE